MRSPKTTETIDKESLNPKQLLEVLTALKRGDLSKRMPVDQTGIAGKIADLLNDIIDQNDRMVKEFERISNEVGQEGKISQRISGVSASGSWGASMNSINLLIGNLVQPNTEVMRVIGAVAGGDLSQNMSLEIEGRPLKGEFLRTAKIVNIMVDQLNSFASEVTRVAREVGTEGKLGGQADVRGVAGTWKDLTDSVNSMASNLTGQVRDIAEVTKAVATGDLSKKITVDVKGEILELKNTINTMVDQLNSFASEVTRVAREVGTEGKLGGQADVRGVAGTWKDLTDSVNSMASNLTGQVRNIADVTTAVARGDLSKKITVDVKGEILELKDTINTMVDQLNSFASEVTRVAREVGTEGKLGGQADVRGVAGTWKDLTDSVNSMASNLTGQVRNIADVTTAVATGDLSKKITVDVKGEILELKDTINTMVDQLNSFASEVTRVAREVGTEGKLGGQADVRGVAGTWKDLTDSVNSMASNLTGQVRNIADVTTAVARGDLSKKITVDVKGEILELKNTINTMVDQLNSFASEVTRVAREVGTEGELGGQADVRGVAGTWKDLTDSVNSMASNLTGQVRNIAEVTTAVARGDLSKKITVDVKGEILELKDTINTMMDQLNSFASEVTRVAREVGTEGKLGGQADVRGVAGTWKDLTDSVNSMASNLTGQVRNIAEVTTAVARGDLSKKITVDVKGEISELKNTINTMVDQLNSFASEVTRVAREVGAEGKLGGQADVRGVAGTWKDLTDSVNFMAGNLTGQVRDIAEVTKAVATGDLSKKITVDVKGEILELKNTINTMVDQLNSFASEVTRVAREVGTEGKLGGQADVRGVAGTWKDLTDSVNSMASNLTGQVRNIAEVTTAVARGDLSKKITVDVKGEILELKDTINTMVDQLNSFASEVTRVAREVGTEGKLGGQANVRGVAGTWKDLTDSVNFMGSNLTDQVRNIAEVTTAVARGDLSKKITVDVKGEISELKNTINTMVDQLNSFASEVTRVAREVGTEGELGGQANVQGVAGTWKDLTDSVNFMANNLTTQVRGIAKVVTSVANGDLKKKLYLEAKGEIAELSDTINDMIDTLGLFGDQVTTVAREVGIEGKLGGQASVPGAAGLWRDLTDNVNQLASNLTTQVRAIAEVATAVTKGDLTRMVTVKAAGEVAALSDNINEMIRNLRETTRINTEQDWLKTNLAKFTRLLQGQRNLVNVSKLILSELAPLVSAQHGAFFITENTEEGSELKLLVSYAYQERKNVSNRFLPGEGMVGQCFLEKERILVAQVPSDYIKISSALGEAAPLNIVVLPVLFEGEVKAVVELASFSNFTPIHLSFLDQLTESIGIVLNTIAAGMRTEELLIQSQTLTEELQGRQEELTKTNERLEEQANSLQASEELLKDQREELQDKNEELEEKARQLAKKNHEVERKNEEVEQARHSLEEKARQLALTSRYKSEFLANMSHELRTPLNNMLILSRLLYENENRKLSSKEIEYAKTIHSSGNDLLQLINDILDLSKIESGKMSVDLDSVSIRELAEYLDRSFKESARNKDLKFHVEINPDLPPRMTTDLQRLQQILQNLLSNAFKFTHKGEVRLKIDPAVSGWSEEHRILNRAGNAIAFSVIDTGIGIPPEKQSLIFEAFRQADGSTSRKYGGTGLGLSISKEITRLLGGELRLESKPDEGSTFTLYLPLVYIPTDESQIDQDQVKWEETEQIEMSAPFSRIFSDSYVWNKPRTSKKVIEEEIPNEFDEKILIIEDDEVFGRRLMDSARTNGFKSVVALDGKTGISVLQDTDVQAVLLDLQLTDMDGWLILNWLKRNSRFRHIPVQVFSSENDWKRSLSTGAISHFTKPVQNASLDEAFIKIRNYLNKEQKKLLLTGLNEEQRKTLEEHLTYRDLSILEASSGSETLETLKKENVDCICIGSHLSDMSFVDLASEMANSGFYKVPIVLYSDSALDAIDSEKLDQLNELNIIKFADTLQKSLDEVQIFLHEPNDVETFKEGDSGAFSGGDDELLQGHRVLIVDDDIRNIFALTSLLEQHKMRILYAENAREGIELLRNNSDIEIVLMDVMMPDMDGYEAMKTIRSMPEFANLPILALTAKAMKGDREKCIEAGATEYITKPVSVDHLLSLLRVLLCR
ncbi:response regulator [Leptospira langatensis]|uniref:histidine kinase n=1 Tax=Leptospira langatensis TaxID=2484983 RepID=A0A5F1ZWU7_9LEPT|nr:HAMP domain-containing protein [Leptospira langatensis]TGJ98417.1 response regulator [Leptospira langatensis]TGL43332.1 response regulator [Leptospira langatensis]